MSIHLCALLAQTYAEMDPTTAALEKEHEAVRISRVWGPAGVLPALLVPAEL